MDNNNVLIINHPIYFIALLIFKFVIIMVKYTQKITKNTNF